MFLKDRAHSITTVLYRPNGKDTRRVLIEAMTEHENGFPPEDGFKSCRTRSSRYRRAMLAQRKRIRGMLDEPDIAHREEFPVEPYAATSESLLALDGVFL